MGLWLGVAGARNHAAGLMGDILYMGRRHNEPTLGQWYELGSKHRTFEQQYHRFTVCRFDQHRINPHTTEFGWFSLYFSVHYIQFRRGGFLPWGRHTYDFLERQHDHAELFKR